MGEQLEIVDSGRGPSRLWVAGLALALAIGGGVEVAKWLREPAPPPSSPAAPVQRHDLTGSEALPHWRGRIVLPRSHHAFGQPHAGWRCFYRASGVGAWVYADMPAPVRDQLPSPACPRATPFTDWPVSYGCTSPTARSPSAARRAGSPSPRRCSTGR